MALSIITLAACSEKTEQSAPSVPAMLIWHDEPPIGSELNHHMVRAAHLTAEYVEPRWGRLDLKIYTVGAADRAALPAAVRRGLPTGWEKEDLLVPGLKYADLWAYSSGDKLFAALAVAPGEAGIIPIIIMRNRALLDAMKASSPSNLTG